MEVEGLLPKTRCARRDEGCRGERSWINRLPGGQASAPRLTLPISVVVVQAPIYSIGGGLDGRDLQHRRAVPIGLEEVGQLPDGQVPHGGGGG